MSIISRTIVDLTRRMGSWRETDITKAVAERLKKDRSGLFQNEIDYRTIFPGFEPVDPVMESGRFRADLMGFHGDEFFIVEYKLFNERRLKGYHHWKACFFLERDIKKLEQAIERNGRLPLPKRGKAIFVFAVKCPRKISESRVQEVFQWLCNKELKKPKVREFDFCSLLKAIQKFTAWQGSGWRFEEVRKSNFYFLIGTKDM